MVSQHTRSSTLLPLAEKNRISQHVPPSVKIKFKVVPHQAPTTKTMERSSGKGKARLSVSSSVNSRSSSLSTSTSRSHAPATTSSSSILEQDSTRCHQDPIPSRVLSTTRTKSSFTSTERARDLKTSEHVARITTSKSENVEACESTNLIIEASQFEDLETSQHDSDEVLGYNSDEEGVVDGGQYLVAKPGLTQKQLKRSSVAWLAHAGAIDEGSLGSSRGSEVSRASGAAEQALDDVLDLILTLIPTKEE